MHILQQCNIHLKQQHFKQSEKLSLYRNGNSHFSRIHAEAVREEGREEGREEWRDERMYVGCR